MVLMPVRVNVPAPVLARLPLPDMGPEKRVLASLPPVVSVAKLQPAGIDGRAAGIGVVARQRQHAAVVLDNAAAALDVVGDIYDGGVIDDAGAAERDGRAAEGIALDAAERPTVRRDRGRDANEVAADILEGSRLAG